MNFLIFLADKVSSIKVRHGLERSNTWDFFFLSFLIVHVKGEEKLCPIHNYTQFVKNCSEQTNELGKVKKKIKK